MRVYLDNCCFNRPFDDQRQIKIRIETEAKLFVQEKIRDKQVELVWSYILEFENENNPFEERKNAIRKWKKIASIDLDEKREIIDEAKMLEKSGIKAKDALHVACAVYSQCEYFVTTDEEIIHKLSDYNKIKIVNPVSLIDKIEG
ncbi:MAG TPA: PIN domain protein [Deltaproteobacteria bacterium]|nr:PIN domain protein [Deltaproteobacteria bacterium]